MELIRVGEKTYYIENNTNIGIYQVDENNVYIIDTGNDTDAGKKILKIINEQNWHILGIINTHSNADHVGGNNVIQTRTNCKIYANNIEKSITEYPILEPSFLYGGYPLNSLKNKFLLAKPSKVKDIDKNLPEGLTYINLKGHFFDMIGIKTSDNVYFLADSLFGEDTINKYHVFFIYDVNEYLNTLDYLDTLDGKLYIPSHIKPTNSIKELIQINRNKINEIIDIIYNYCKEPKTFEEILTHIFNTYNLQMNINQYVLVGSTIRSYLSYMYNSNKLNYEFKDNKMLWIVKE